MAKSKTHATTAAELAERYQVDRNTIKKWISDGGPRKVGGRYDLKKWDAWVAKNKTKVVGDHSKSNLEREKLALFIRRLTREENVADDKLIPVVDVERYVEKLGGRVKVELLRFRKTIGMLLGVEAEKKARLAVEATLKALEEKPLG